MYFYFFLIWSTKNFCFAEKNCVLIEACGIQKKKIASHSRPQKKHHLRGTSHPSQKNLAPKKVAPSMGVKPSVLAQVSDWTIGQGVPFSTVPRSFKTRLEPHLDRVLLLRRLRLPLPPTAHLCRCGRFLAFGHIAQRAPKEGCWPDGGSQWRLPPPKCVEKQA